MPSTPTKKPKHASTLYPSTSAFGATSPSSPHRLSTQFTHTRSYSASEQPATQLVTEPATSLTNDGHQDIYILMSHGSDYALVEVSSRGFNDQDPLLHFGEELTGFIVLSPGALRGMQRVDLAVFDSHPIIPSGETKRVLLPQQVDVSHFSDGQYRWPFSIPPPAITTSSASSSSVGQSSLGHRSNDRNSDPEFKLVVTMHRPGLFTRNVAVRQQIRYVAPPDPSIPPCSSPISFDHPPNLITDPSWSPQKFPPVMVRGIMFSQHDIEVECKLFVPTSYPVSDIIPLSLTMTSENREALDLVALPDLGPDVIDVRLIKVMGFGEKGKVIQPLSLMNRSLYHRTDLAAESIWELDGHPEELPTSEEHPWPRWRIRFNGNLRRKATVRLVPSFEDERMIIRYLVCLYPFRAPDFRPAGDPNKPLFMGNLPLRKQL
ncbi:hypothetical protein BJV78DRAFT_1151867 [Lactifluus subvellereus]|nr:hypothetical protein BJV78DRAFT_1151867 [Lactifluus subvellereus]